MKNSYLTATDQFCGAGGSSQGARKAGVEVKLALNHWKLAIETHNTNFPDTLHHCTDVSASDPRIYPSTDILITSPECKTHTPSGGNTHKQVKSTLDLFDKGIIDPATERSRATMWDVCRFAEYHNYNAIVVENVVEAKTRWVLFDVWLQAMHRLGYQHKTLFLNSQHFWPTPQSRDRMYVVFWKKGNKAPDLDYRPKAFCPCCGKDVNAVQAWKPKQKAFKYRTGYVYVCPADGVIVEPYYYAAFNALDWSNLGKRIGDRKKPLSSNTMKRIQWGLDKYGTDPMVVQTRQTSGIECRVKNVFENPIGTQVTDVSHAMATPLILRVENGSSLKNARPATDVFSTQTVRQTSAVISATPWIIEMNKTGEGKPACNPMSTITAGGINHALMGVPLMVENKGQSKSKTVLDPASTMTTKPYHGILSHEAWSSFLQYYYGKDQASMIHEPIDTMNTRDRAYMVNFQKPKIEDCYYRMIKASEVKASMAFEKNYIILGDSKEQVKQCGNAVTPPVQEWIIGQVVKSLS